MTQVAQPPQPRLSDDDPDVQRFLRDLCLRCLRLFPVAAAGLVVPAASGEPELVAFSDRRTRALALVEAGAGGGPWRDAILTGTPVRVSGELAAQRWPDLMHAARHVGLKSVAAVPLRWQDQSLGALALFADQDALLDDRDLRMAQALVDNATVLLLNARLLNRYRKTVAQLEEALGSRIVLEQAKGMLAVRLGLPLEQAFAVMRCYARDHNRKLAEVAQAVLDGDDSISELTEG
jgi:GAF domain-containing protein